MPRYITRHTLALITTLSLGFGLVLSTSAPQDAQARSPINKKVAAATDSDLIPVGQSPSTSDQAPITIVIFGDFQCPFCERASHTVKRIKDENPSDVRLVYKHYPLPFHQEADEAARAAIAAHKQGAFWNMHDKLYANTRNLRGFEGGIDALLEQYALDLGLDLEQFRKDYKSDETAKQLKEDMELAQKLGVRGTPHFFINGERVSGAQPYEKFKEIVDRQRDEAKGTAAKHKDAYAQLVRKHYKAPEPPAAPKPAAAEVAYVPVSKQDAVKGDTKKALVTIVEFSDFQCPFCTRGTQTMRQLTQKYGDDVRLVFKHMPLPFHAQADEAARAAIAAGKQGKFWEMHDQFFDNQAAFREAAGDPDGLMISYARLLKLDIKRFERDYRDAKTQKHLQADIELAKELGARGTPTFYVNGIKLVGAQPASAFEQVIDAQIKEAKALQAKDKKLSGEKLYKALAEQNAKAAPALPKHKEDDTDSVPRQHKPELSAQDNLKKLAVTHSPTFGPSKAQITIYEFTDLQCPFCARSTSTIDELMKRYPGKIRLVTKNNPLIFHKQATDAAHGLMAAHKQGKGELMRKKIFENYSALSSDPELISTLAQEIGLDMNKFEADRKSDEIAQQVKADLEMGRSLGVTGTPTFFVNGHKLVGAQPAAKFSEIIDAELKSK